MTHVDDFLLSSGILDLINAGWDVIEANLSAVEEPVLFVDCGI